MPIGARPRSALAPEVFACDEHTEENNVMISVLNRGGGISWLFTDAEK
jgi:hypothetical protein